jgi:hypothetical protein
MGVAPAHQLHQEKEISMSTITVPRADVTAEEVAEALRDRLDDRYNVRPGMRMTRNPFGKPQGAQPDQILVDGGSGAVVRAQVHIIQQTDRTEIRITPGGLAGQLVLNTFGIAREVRRVLLEAPGLGSRPGSR